VGRKRCAVAAVAEAEKFEVFGGEFKWHSLSQRFYVSFGCRRLGDPIAARLAQERRNWTI